MNLDHFGMDTITLAGPLEPKLRAVRAAGFTQIMLSAADIVGHPDGEPAAMAAVRTSGLRVNRIPITAAAEGNRANSAWCECCRSRPLTSGASLPPVFRPKDSNGIARRRNETCQRPSRRGETDYRGL